MLRPEVMIIIIIKLFYGDFSLEKTCQGTEQK